MKQSRKFSAQSFNTLPAWGTAEDPPTEFLLFPLGATKATKFGGERITVYLTPDNAKAIVEEWSRRGIGGHFDYDHAILGDSPTGTPSAGGFTLAARSDGLWVTAIKWTPRALAYFKAKEIQYYSPYFNTDDKNQIIGLLNVALTNWPATDNQRPLIALSNRAHRFNMLTPEQEAAFVAILEAFAAEGKDANTAQAILDIQKVLSGSAPAEPTEPDPAMAEIAASARSLTSKVKASEVIGVLQAAFDAKATNKTLADRVHKLESERIETKILSSTLTPSQKTWALATILKPGGFETVASYIESAASDKPAGPHVEQVKPPVKEAETDSAMKAYCAAKGFKFEIFKATHVKVNGSRPFVAPK